MKSTKLLFSLSLLAMVLAACSGAQTVTETAPTVEIEREPLGESQLIARQTGSAMVTIRVVFDAGSAEDLPGQEGATALAADLMVEGGAGDLSYAQITERLFPMAANVGAQTSRDQTVFVGRVHRDHLDDFYAIFRSVLLEPRLGQVDFDRLRTRAQNSVQLELRGNNDEELGKETLQAMIYQGHPYGHPASGTVSALEVMTLDDVLAQRQRVFCGGRATIGVQGGYPDGFAAQVRADVDSLSFTECAGRRILPEPELDGPRVWLVEKPDVGAVAVSMGMPVDIVRGDPDYPALVFALAYFGQHRTFTGRLMNEMRGERGLNYGDYAYIEHFDQDGWSAMPAPNSARRQQYFSIWIRPVNVDQAHFAIRMAVKELREFVENGLSQEDFDRILPYVQGYYALFLQTESRQLGFAVDDAFYGHEAAWLDMLLTQWSQLTGEDLNEAISRHVDPTNLQIAVVHPNALSFADQLASEAPSPIEYAAEPPEEVLEEDLAIVPYRVGIDRTRMTPINLDDIFR